MMYLDWKIIINNLRNSASVDDLKQLEQWKNENSSNTDFYDKIEAYYHNLEQEPFAIADEKIDEMWNKGMKKRILRRKLSRKTIITTTVAATVLLSFLSAYLLLRNNQIDNLTGNAIKTAPKSVRITTETGYVYSVSNDNNDVKKVLTINEDKKLDYTATADKETISEEIIYHKIEVPKGLTYTFILSDSTEVLINANSELSYPKSFSSSSCREVFLKGEAYFKVKKENKLFIVNTDCSQIKVYGTEFNVNCYNSLFTETVLVQGSVGVRSIKSGNEITIKPNQKSIISNSGENVVSNIDVRGYTSWKEAYFFYNGEPLKNIVIALSNWYDVKFEFENKAVENVEIVASFDRNLSLKEIFTMIENSTFVKFKNEGGIVKVY